jgi:hypothetical protein
MELAVSSAVWISECNLLVIRENELKSFRSSTIFDFIVQSSVLVIF